MHGQADRREQEGTEEPRCIWVGSDAIGAAEDPPYCVRGNRIIKRPPAAAAGPQAAAAAPKKRKVAAPNALDDDRRQEKLRIMYATAIRNLREERQRLWPESIEVHHHQLRANQ
jgi:hypothetical protein